MEPIPFKVGIGENATIFLRANGPNQYEQFHFHPEFQVSLIRSGKGVACIGHRVLACQEGDIFVVGSDVPHVFRAAKDQPTGCFQTLNLFFLASGLGAELFQLPEMAGIRHFLNDCSRGVQLGRKLARELRPCLLDLQWVAGPPRLIKLLSLLHAMSCSRDKTFLSSPRRAEADSRLHRIFNYIYDNFHRPIPLEEAARVANLSKYAFCRYFKQYTHKSFVRYLNEFRISMACKYLTRSSNTVMQVSLQAGFNNLSNFNRQFKRIMHCTPTEYRELVRRYIHPSPTS